MTDFKDDDVEDFGDDAKPVANLSLDDDVDEALAALIQELHTKYDAAPSDALAAQLGRAYMDADQEEAAVQWYEQAISLNPSNASHVHGKALVYLNANEAGEAEALLKQALALAPNDAEIIFDLGRAYQAEDNTEAALGAFKQAVEKNPNHGRALFQVASAAHTAGRVDEAIATFRKSAEADPTNAAAFFQAGQLLQTRNHGDDLKTAAELFTKAASVDSSDSEAFARLIQTYDQLNQLDKCDEARQNFVAAFNRGDLNPNFRAIGRYVCARFEVEDKFVMCFDHLKPFGPEPLKYSFVVYKKGEVREDKILYRVVILNKGGHYHLDAFHDTEKVHKHYKDLGAAEPSYQQAKTAALEVIKGAVQPASSSPIA